MRALTSPRCNENRVKKVDGALNVSAGGGDYSLWKANLPLPCPVPAPIHPCADTVLDPPGCPPGRVFHMGIRAHAADAIRKISQGLTAGEP